MKADKKRPSALRTLGRVLGAVLAVILLAGLAFFVIPLTERADRTPVPGSAAWMEKLPDTLPLNAIVLPGTHDSATQYVQLAFFSKCQSLSIAEQLEAGCRYLDIRLGTEGDGDFTLMHGFTNCKSGVFGGKLTLDAVLEACYAFLDAHPQETVLFAAKYEHGELPVPAVQEKLAAVIAARSDKWLLSDTVPTLGQARGKLVLLRRWEDEAGLGPDAGISFLWADQKSREDTQLSAVTERQPGYTLWVQDRFKYDTAEKWVAFTTGLAAPYGKRDVLLSFLSTNGSAAYGHPWKHARLLNTRFEAITPASLHGWIVLDFVSPRLAEKVYSVNFK